ncbi:hypothetical protein K2X89_18250 [Myxococcota bacterium]|nr:hypothetical protein [Myxococcota bacterium]
MLVVLLASTATAWAEGETFVPPYDPPVSEWEIVPDPNRPTARIWKSRSNPRDLFRVESLIGAVESLAEIRMTLDAPGKASCAVFDTTTLRDRPANGYPRLIWRTDCTKEDGSKGSFLNLAIRGRDGLHLAMKIWQLEVGKAEVDTWIARFDQSYVCVPGEPGRPCPAKAAP